MEKSSSSKRQKTAYFHTEKDSTTTNERKQTRTVLELCSGDVLEHIVDFLQLGELRNAAVTCSAIRRAAVASNNRRDPKVECSVAALASLFPDDEEGYVVAKAVSFENDLEEPQSLTAPRRRGCWEGKKLFRGLRVGYSNEQPKVSLDKATDTFQFDVSDGAGPEVILALPCPPLGPRPKESSAFRDAAREIQASLRLDNDWRRAYVVVWTTHVVHDRSMMLAEPRPADADVKEFNELGRKRWSIEQFGNKTVERDKDQVDSNEQTHPSEDAATAYCASVAQTLRDQGWAERKADEERGSYFSGDILATSLHFAVFDICDPAAPTLVSHSHLGTHEIDEEIGVGPAFGISKDARVLCTTVFRYSYGSMESEEDNENKPGLVKLWVFRQTADEDWTWERLPAVWDREPDELPSCTLHVDVSACGNMMLFNYQDEQGYHSFSLYDTRPGGSRLAQVYAESGTVATNVFNRDNTIVCTVYNADGLGNLELPPCLHAVEVYGEPDI